MTNQARLIRDTVRALALVLDFDEGQKLYHAWRVALLSAVVARGSGLCPPEVAYHGGLLHDLGGLGLPDHLVHHAARGFLDAEAREHAHRGADILAPFLPFAACLAPIRDHHERFDGRGFPAGKAGDAVGAAAYVLHLADHLEVVLRASPAANRRELAVTECRRAAGTRVSAPVAEAFSQRLEANPDLVERLYDDAALAEDLDALEAPAPADPGLHTPELLSQLLWLLARVVDAKHPLTMGHSVRVAYWAFRIARELPAPRPNPWDVVWAGLLHDVGKVAVPRTLLDKRQALSAHEWRTLKRHARHSMELIGRIRDLAHLAYPAAAHHERYAGGGYPLGHAREDIPLIGRVLAFADAYDAMTSERGYNVPLTHTQALASLAGNVGSQFDPRLAATALRVLETASRTSTEELQTLGGFADFFRREEASFLSLVESAGTSATVVETGRGPALVEVPAWHRLRVDADFSLIEGKDELVRFVMNHASEHLLDFLDTQDHTSLRLAAGRLAPGGHEGLVVRTTGGLPLELVLLRPEDSGPDLTVLFRSIESAAHTARQLAMVHTNFTAGNDAVAFLDPERLVIDVNHRFEALTGIPRERHLGRGLEAVLDEAARDQLKESTFSGELAFLRSDGARVVADAALVPLADAAGRPMGYLLRAVDISARKEAEARLAALTAELEAANAELTTKNAELESLNRLKSDLMAITSHDLKSPLAAMITQAHFLLELPELPPERVRRGLGRIVEAGEKLVGFIQDLLDLERLDAGAFRFEPAPEPVAPLIREAVETARAHAGEVVVSLACDPACDGLSVATEPRRLLQVLHNLVGNAVKFSPPGGAVRVGCALASGDRVRLSVEDEGPGIPPDQLQAIFDRYHQVRDGAQGTSSSPRAFAGAGLGLFIVRRLVDLHGGRVWAESDPATRPGSRFIVELPTVEGKS